MYTSRIYKRSPIIVQNALVSARAYTVRIMRKSSSSSELDDIERSQWLTADALAQLQLKRLQAVVGQAAVHVPYYRDVFSAADFAPEQLTSLADIERIPPLTKHDVFNQAERMLAANVTGCRFLNSTSGTTGMSLKLWRNLYSINRESAFIARQCTWAGVKSGDRRVWIRADKIVPAEARKPPFWRYNTADNTIMMSAYHLSEQYAEAYIKVMEAFDPVYGMAYVSPLAFLARYLLNTGRRYRGKALRCFITSSETLDDEQRQVIYEAFGCKIYDWYGSSERVSAIGTCEQGNYHLLSDYGYTELLPQANGSYQLVGTGFDNVLMPLIRYQLGDSIMLADPAYRCPCGRHFPVVERVSGRIEDYLIKPDGGQIFMAGGIIDGLDNILESQIRQDKLGEVRILIVSAYGRVVDEATILGRAREVLGGDMRIKIEQVESIAKTTHGKFRAVVRTVA
jgi:phenylacetate-CoA ligase